MEEGPTCSRRIWHCCRDSSILKQPEVKVTLRKYVTEKSVTGSKEKKVHSCLEREAVGERHQQSRGRIRENQENGKKEPRTSEKKAGEYRCLEVHKNAVKKEKTLGTSERERNALNN